MGKRTSETKEQSNMPGGAEDFGEPLLRSLHEKVLLSIIDAYPSADQAPVGSVKHSLVREKRLRQASQALFGYTTNGRPPDFHRPALLHMARLYNLDRWAVFQRRHGFQVPPAAAPKPRSVRSLAQQVAKEFYPDDDTNIFETLKRRFSKQIDYWRHLDDTHDDVAEEVEGQCIVAFASAAEKVGIKMRPAISYSAQLRRPLRREGG